MFSGPGLSGGSWSYHDEHRPPAGGYPTGTGRRPGRAGEKSQSGLETSPDETQVKNMTSRKPAIGVTNVKV